MTITARTLLNICASLPPFEKYQYDSFQVRIPLMTEVVVVVDSVPPVATVPIHTATFVKNHRLQEWVLREITYGAQTVSL